MHDSHIHFRRRGFGTKYSLWSKCCRLERVVRPDLTSFADRAYLVDAKIDSGAMLKVEKNVGQCTFHPPAGAKKAWKAT